MAWVLDLFLRTLAPAPRPRSLWDFARSLRIHIVDPDTGEDKWVMFRPETHPAQHEILRRFAAGGFLDMVILGPVQDGKTTVAIVVGMLYCLVELRQSVSLMLPDEAKAMEIWDEKVVPVIKASGLTWILPTDGPGARGGTARSMLCNTGARVHLVGAGGQNESAQSGYTVRFVFIDERSKIRPHFVRLGIQRQAAYGEHGRAVSTSTLREEVGDNSWEAYQDSTCGRLAYACPHCVASAHATGGWQIFTHTQLRYDPTSDDSARDSAYLECQHDATHRITDPQLKAALATWRVVHRGQKVDGAGVVSGDIAPSSTAGFLWTCWDSPLKRLGKIALTHRKAVVKRDAIGDHTDLRILHHEDFVEPYTGDREHGRAAIDALGLATLSSRSTYGKREVPAWAQFLTIAQDVQKGLHYWQVMAHGPERRRAIIDWGYETCVPYIDGRPSREPTDDEHIRVLDAIEESCMAGWQVQGESNRTMVPIVGGMDVGYREALLLTWILAHPQWMACKGVGEDQAGKMDRTAAEGKAFLDPEVAQQLRGVMDVRQPATTVVEIAFVNGSLVRQGFHDALMRPPGPGHCGIPHGQKSNDTLPLHLSAEIWKRDPTTGKFYWYRVRKRNDQLDCAVINDAMGTFWAIYQPWLAANTPEPAAPRASAPPPSAPPITTPDGRPFLLSER